MRELARGCPSGYRNGRPPHCGPRWLQRSRRWWEASRVGNQPGRSGSGFGYSGGAPALRNAGVVWEAPPDRHSQRHRHHGAGPCRRAVWNVLSNSSAASSDGQDLAVHPDPPHGHLVPERPMVLPRRAAVGNGGTAGAMDDKADHPAVSRPGTREMDCVSGSLRLRPTCVCAATPERRRQVNHHACVSRRQAM